MFSSSRLPMSDWLKSPCFPGKMIDYHYEIVMVCINPDIVIEEIIFVQGTLPRFCSCARVWFQRCGNWHRAFTNLFASSSINFGFALKLLRIKDQWDMVLVKCQSVCNRDLSVLTSMPFDGTSSGGKCYGAGRRQLSPSSFQQGLENRERTEK